MVVGIVVSVFGWLLVCWDGWMDVGTVVSVLGWLVVCLDDR
jgi:hypothetical protein